VIRERLQRWGGTAPRPPAGPEIADTGLRVVHAVTQGAVPELMRVIQNYNIVQFDGTYYAVPHGLAVDFESPDVRGHPDIFAGPTVKSVCDWVSARTAPVDRTPTAAFERDSDGAAGPAGEITHTPVLLDTFAGYNIVTFEGWVYGIPQVLGDTDLSEVDVIGLPGVIRDVSRDVVESEILERIRSEPIAHEARP